MMLSANFSLEELVATQHRGIDNTPPAEAIDNLRELAGMLELLRMNLGPLHITSGYRSPALNAAVKGQPSSQHCQGLAADFIAPRFTLPEATRRLLESAVVFDQLIYEFGSWIHISHPPLGRLARCDRLMIGTWTSDKYLPLDLAKVPR